MKIQKIIIIGILTFFSNFLVAQVFTNYTSETSDLSENAINGGVAIDQNNNKWFGTAHGIVKFDDVNWTTYSTTDGLTDYLIKCIAVDANNNIWAGTEFGANKFDGTTWTTYNSSDGLPSDDIIYICGDSVGNVWFATYSGLSKFDGTNFTNYTTDDGLLTNSITCIAVGSQNDMWIGTFDEGISKFDGTNFTNFGMASGIIDDCTITLFIDHNDNKWVGTFHGVSVFDSNDDWVANYTVSDGLFGDYIYDIKEDFDGNIWFGINLDYVCTGAVTKFDGTTWVSYSVDDGLVDSHVKQMAIDNQGSIWIATGGGISKLEFVTEVKDLDFNNQVNIYPNPASQILNVEIENAFTQGDNKIEILNSLGQIMNEYYVTNNDKLSISLENYSNGIYLINTGKKTSKFVVNK